MQEAGTDPSSTGSGGASWPLSISFFSYSRAGVTAPWLLEESPRPPEAGLFTAPESYCCGLPVHRGCSHAGLARPCPEPPPVGKGHGRWASSHSNLGFRTLSSPHNGPGGHSRPACTPSLCTALLGNGLFLPLLGQGWGGRGGVIFSRDQPTATSLLAQALGVDPQSSWGDPDTRGGGALRARQRGN